MFVVYRALQTTRSIVVLLSLSFSLSSLFQIFFDDFYIINIIALMILDL